MSTLTVRSWAPDRMDDVAYGAAIDWKALWKRAGKRVDPIAKRRIRKAVERQLSGYSIQRPVYLLDAKALNKNLQSIRDALGGEPRKRRKK